MERLRQFASPLRCRAQSLFRTGHATAMIATDRRQPREEGSRAGCDGWLRLRRVDPDRTIDVSTIEMLIAECERTPVTFHKAL
jgi:copper homeostasis protein CutC